MNCPMKPSFRLFAALSAFAVISLSWAGVAAAQTDCNMGSDILDTAQPKGISVPELIQKFTANESKVEKLRDQYTYTQDLLVQTLEGTSVDGQFHRITQVSYDEIGRA